MSKWHVELTTNLAECSTCLPLVHLSGMVILFQHLRTERLIGIQPCECGALSFGEVRLQVESKMLYLVSARHTQVNFCASFFEGRSSVFYNWLEVICCWIVNWPCTHFCVVYTSSREFHVRKKKENGKIESHTTQSITRMYFSCDYEPVPRPLSRY